MIFVAFGGSGSSYLKRKLCELGTCHIRPDAQFKPSFWPTGGGQKLGKKGYQSLPSLRAIRDFQSRTDFQFDSAKTVDKNMLDYIDHINRKGIDAILTLSSYYNFFSRNGIRDVVFLVRHPLHQYGSWFKMKRHGAHLKPMGGKNSRRSIKYFTTVWNSFVGEYLNLKRLNLSPVLIRYELADSDVKTANNPYIAERFAGWKTDRRNPDFIKPPLQELMKSQVEKAYTEIYPKWEI